MSNISKLKSSFLKILCDKNIKIVSFDVFETLLFRKQYDPKIIFDIIGKNDYVKSIFHDSDNFRSYRINAEKLARKNNHQKEDITIYDIYQELPISVEQQNKIIDIELEIELNNLVLNLDIKDWIVICLSKNIKIIFTSDMYLTKDLLENIITNKLDKSFEYELFVSSDIQKTKGSGNLFKYIKDFFQIEFENILHIGDKYIADYSKPNSLGMSSILYNISDYGQNILKKENDMYPNIDFFRTLRVLSALNNQYKDEESFYYDLGAMVYGPILHSFSTWLLELSKDSGIEQINFIMREGFILKECFDLLNSNIKTNLIYVSRKSSNLATLDTEIFDNYDKFIVYFSVFKIEEIFSFLEEDIPLNYNKYSHIKIEEAMFLKHNNQILSFSIFSFFLICKESIVSRVNEKKDLLIKYLQSKDISRNSIFVDFGARGSILHNLLKIDKHLFRYGCLFYSTNNIEFTMSKMFYKFISKTEYNKKDFTHLFRTPDIMEILFNGVEETTIGYEKSQNTMVPVTKNVSKLNSGMNGCFKDGIKKYFQTFDKYCFGTQVLSVNNDLLKILTRQIIDPNKNEVDILGNLEFDLGGSRNKYMKIIPNIQNNDNSELELYNFNLNFEGYQRDNISWIHGYIAKKNKNFLSKVYGNYDYKNVDNAVNSVYEVILNLGLRSVVIYGLGEFYFKLKHLLNENEIIIEYLIDYNADVKEFLFDTHEVKSMKHGLTNDCNIVIASAGSSISIFTRINSYCKMNNIRLNIIDNVNGYTKIE